MQPGYELVDKQLFFRKELIERVYWFIGLRWIIVGAAFVASWVAYIFWRPLPILAVTIIHLSVVLYNIVFFFTCRRLKPSEVSDFRPFNRFAYLQISLDLLALYSVTYFTGGIYSPLLIFFIFHIILAGILLSPISAFVYGISVVLSLAALIVLENLAILPSQPVLFQTHVKAYPIDSSRLLTTYFAFTAAILFMVFLIISFKVSLRTKGRELLRVSKELDESNAKLTALYEMVKEMGLCSDLQELMDIAAKNAAKIMGVKACSIKLLDEQR